MCFLHKLDFLTVNNSSKWDLIVQPFLADGLQVFCISHVTGNESIVYPAFCLKMTWTDRFKMQQYCFGIVSAICSEVSETPTEVEILN